MPWKIWAIHVTVFAIDSLKKYKLDGNSILLPLKREKKYGDGKTIQFSFNKLQPCFLSSWNREKKRETQDKRNKIYCEGYSSCLEGSARTQGIEKVSGHIPFVHFNSLQMWSTAKIIKQINFQKESFLLDQETAEGPERTFEWEKYRCSS